MDLTPASCEEIACLIKGYPGKSCLLDPIPTWLTKTCIEVLTPVITSIVNMSLSSAAMLAGFKMAILLPLLKKISLDPEIFNNFRPNSNLMYISKLTERVVVSRPHSHMITNDLYEENQSSYRKLHSTETALVSVNDDILRAIDDNKCILLIMLDLSAAFDTVDHEILLGDYLAYLIFLVQPCCGSAPIWLIVSRKLLSMMYFSNQLLLQVEYHRGQFSAEYCLHSVCYLLMKWLEAMVFNRTCMPMIVSYT